MKVYSMLQTVRCPLCGETEWGYIYQRGSHSRLLICSDCKGLSCLRISGGKNNKKFEIELLQKAVPEFDLWD